MESSVQKLNQTRGVVLVTVSALMFGSYGVWSRLLGPYFGVFTQGWTRACIAGLLLLPFVVWKKEFISIARKDWGWLLLYLVFTSATQTPIYYAFNHMDIGTATLLFYVTVLITMYAVGGLFLGEKLTRVKIISFVLACLGLYTVFSFSLSRFTFLAASMAVLNGIASGGEIAFSKKLSNSYGTLYLTLLSWVIIVLTSIPLSIYMHEPLVAPAFNLSWLYMVGYAVAGLFGFWLVIAGLKYVEASIGGLLGLLEILFSIVLGVVLFHELVSNRIIVGAVLILVAAALPHIVDLWQRKNPLVI